MIIRLTKRQHEVIAFLCRYLKATGRPPVLREICAEFDWSAVNSATCHLERLEAKGWISWERKVARGVRVLRWVE